MTAEATVNARRWVAGETDSGSVLAMGNGRLLAYARGPNLFQVQGPPYSAPSVAALRVAETPGLGCVSSREVGAGVWHHTLTLHGAPIGTLTDFVDAEVPGLVRLVALRQPVEFVLDMPCSAPAPGPVSGTDGRVDLLALLPAGSRIYGDLYVAPRETAARFAATGQVQLVGSDGEADGRWRLRCGPGESVLAVTGGPEYPQCTEHTERLLASPPAERLRQTRAWWQDWRSGLGHPPLRDGAPLCQDLLAAVDETAVIIRTQQSAEGAVVAGYPYVMGYVRDQYGVSRGLLALGDLAGARGILGFYWRIFQRYGRIHNAQCVGQEGVFHRHENDDVEITGYLLVQAFDYLRAGGDEAFVEEIEPLLAWAFGAQVRHLAGGMLPFNGDETYIAIGAVPRSVLLDGSAESTLLFIEGGQRYLDWCARRGRSRPAGAASVAEARARYAANFWADGRLWANQPARTGLVPPPRFRHGVCLGDHQPGCRSFGWTERGADGRYRCPRCLARQSHQPAAPQRYFLPSIAFTSRLIGADLVDHEQSLAMLGDVVAHLERTGHLAQTQSGVVPGYESGVLLHALVALGHPAAESLYRLCLGLRDDTGAWVEAYAGGTPGGTRYRPWESALNLVGALAFARG